jgi:hypothetical protein
VAIVVGIITYAIVLNMDFLNKKLNAYYHPRRQYLVNEMKKESGYWEKKGNRFERFQPTTDNQVPTEWWIPLYLFRTIFTRIFGRKRNVVITDKPSTTPTIKDASDDNQTNNPPAGGQQQSDGNDADLNHGDLSNVKQPEKVASTNMGSPSRPSLRSRIFGRFPRGKRDGDHASV